MNIADNINRIRDTISQVAAADGRDASEVALVAAAKTQNADSVRQAIAAGVDAVGENRVQEMAQKAAQGAYDGAPLHFIGHLQTNKVSKVVGECGLIESVDSVELITLIGQRAVSLGITQDILIEVNIGSEPQKSGILPERADEILELASKTGGINVLGLMAVPPLYDQNENSCYYFDAMLKLFVDISVKKYDNVSMRFLSMGMSDSYIDAIRAGSNMVRIGSAIFGAR